MQDDLGGIVWILLGPLADTTVADPKFFDVNPHLLKRDFLLWPQGFMNFVYCHGSNITILRYSLSTKFFTYLRFYALMFP